MGGLTRSLSKTQPFKPWSPERRPQGPPSLHPQGQNHSSWSTASPPSTSAAAEECSVQASDMGCSGFITIVSCLQQDFKNRQIPVLFESHVSDQIMLSLETQFLIYEMGAWKCSGLFWGFQAMLDWSQRWSVVIRTSYQWCSEIMSWSPRKQPRRRKVSSEACQVMRVCQATRTSDLHNTVTQIIGGSWKLKRLILF